MSRKSRPTDWMTKYIVDPVDAYEQGADDIYKWAYLKGFEEALALTGYGKYGEPLSRFEAVVDPVFAIRER